MAGSRLFYALAIVGVSVGWLPVAWGGAARPVAPALLVMPGNNIPFLTIGMDVLGSRPAILLGYQQTSGMDTPVVHAWDGTEWRQISLGDYETFRYLRVPPSQVILVSKGESMPAALAVGAWGDQYGLKVQKISAETTSDLLNELGRIFDFRRSEWEWYAARYQLDIADANQDRRSQSWYDQPMVLAPRKTPQSAVVIDSSEATQDELEFSPIEPVGAAGLPEPDPADQSLMPVPSPGQLIQPPVK